MTLNSLYQFIRGRMATMEQCKICGGSDLSIEYDGIIRDGGLGKYTPKPVKMYRCNQCKVICHEPMMDLDEYYTSKEYRMSLEGTITENDFYNLHDKESIDKLLYTGMVYRNKVVADIGCGCGAFMDLVSGLCGEVIAVEPTHAYRDILSRKGYRTYCYAKDALKDYKESVDVVVSFDVIEHVESPLDFIKDVYDLLRKGGEAYIGTPTETPVMRKLLGECYERKLLFSTQHLWVFGEDSLMKIAEASGFVNANTSVKYFQRYGISNVLGWLKYQEPGKKVDDEMISDAMDMAWRRGIEEQGLSDYIVLRLIK